ncbi:MAG: hypothetical protein QOD99_2290 [Chthoniobacter sp.]|jgi:hypothetical protein|nr:hypothetical protein [Chthoniobacter sp.]
MFMAMKPLLAAALAMFLLQNAAHSVQTYVYVSCSGSILREVEVSPTNKRIKASPLNNARIFAEFGVSPADYALVTPHGLGSVSLMPVDGSSGLPTLAVFSFNYSGSTAMTDTHTAHLMAQGAVSSSGSGIFQSLVGRATALLSYDANFTNLHRVNYTIVATGTDPAAAGKNVFIHCKVHSGKVFRQL